MSATRPRMRFTVGSFLDLQKTVDCLLVAARRSHFAVELSFE
jgi:hypothetical protein